MAARSTKEGQTGIDGIRKPIDILKKFFLHVLEKSESCTGSRGWVKVRESRYRAMQDLGQGMAVTMRAPFRYSSLRVGDTEEGEGEEGGD